MYCSSSTLFVYGALATLSISRCSQAVRSDAPGPVPQWPCVVPTTRSEYGCGFAVPSRARTRHW